MYRNRPESGRTRTLLTRAGDRNHASHHCTPVRPPRFTNPCSLAGSLLSVGPLGGPRAPTVPAAGTTHGRRASAPWISRAPPPPPAKRYDSLGGPRPPGAFCFSSCFSPYSASASRLRCYAEAQLAGVHALLKPLDDPVEPSPGQAKRNAGGRCRAQVNAGAALQGSGARGTRARC